MSTPKDILEQKKLAKEKQLKRLTETELYKKVQYDELQAIGNNGRPKIVGVEKLKKLYETFIIGGTDEEACFYAEISTQTLYNFQKEYPEFIELKEQWKQNPILKARNTVFSNLDRDENARWFLERKKKEEFATRQEVTGANGNGFLSTDLKTLKTNYGELADELAQEVREQSVANEPPIQNQE